MKQRVIDWWANPENKEKVWKGMAWAAWIDISISVAAVLAAVGLQAAGQVEDLTLTEIIMNLVTDWTSYQFIAIWVVLYFWTGSPRIVPWKSPARNED